MQGCRIAKSLYKCHVLCASLSLLFPPLAPLLESADNLDILISNLQKHIGALVQYLLPVIELETFAWMQQYIIFYFVENFEDQQHAHGSIENGTEHKYGNDDGLRTAVETCMKVIGWEMNPDCEDVGTIFAIPRQALVEAPGQETTLGILGGDFTDFRTRNEHLDLWGRSLGSFFEEQRLQSCPGSIGSMLNLLKDMHRSRRANLFTTAGGYLGANICRIQPGDEIHLLFGCRMPIVLRRLDSTYRLVGSVYVYGAMDGEVMNGLDANGALPEEVVIV